MISISYSNEFLNKFQEQFYWYYNYSVHFSYADVNKPKKELLKQIAKNRRILLSFLSEEERKHIDYFLKDRYFSHSHDFTLANKKFIYDNHIFRYQSHFIGCIPYRKKATEPKPKGTGMPRITKNNLEEYLSKPNFYVYYQEYKNNYIKNDVMQTVYFLVSDVDNITYFDLVNLFKIENQVFRGKSGKFYYPTYVLNSGNGIHLLYLLEQPYDYQNNRTYIEKVNEALQTYLNNLTHWNINGKQYPIFKGNKFRKGFKVDTFSFTHPYRAPFSRTKFGTIANLYQHGSYEKKYNIDELAEDFLGINKNNLIINKPKIKEKPIKPNKTIEKPKNIENKEPIKRKNIFYKNDKFKVFPTGSKYFYKYYLSLHTQIVYGYRYPYCSHMAMVGCKCRIPYEQVEKDMRKVLEFFNQRDIIKRDIEQTMADAMRCYDPKYALVSWKKICLAIGIPYVKKTHIPISKHLEIINQKRKIKSEEKKQKAIALYTSGYPKTIIAEMLGISYQSVKNYLADISVNQTEMKQKAVLELYSKKIKPKDISKELCIPLKTVYYYLKKVKENKEQEPKEQKQLEQLAN